MPVWVQEMSMNETHSPEIHPNHKFKSWKSASRYSHFRDE